MTKNLETLKAEWNATAAAYAAADYAATTAANAANAAAAADLVAYRAYAAAAAQQWLRRTDLDSLSIEIRKQEAAVRLGVAIEQLDSLASRKQEQE